ncbi:MAG: DUF4922 domain-containing protein [Bacteroidales bacterium]
MEEKKLSSQGRDLQDQVYELLDQQTRHWDLAEKNYKGLEKVQKHWFTFEGGMRIGVQFNAERIYSSAAKVDAKSISERKCFLCPAHLPQQQKWVEFGTDYLILVNPFPIFPHHLTIPHREHIDQRIRGRMADMLGLAKDLHGFEVFYNGPKCGASAPDHFHFQAGNKGFMPLDSEFAALPKTKVRQHNNCTAWTLDNYLRQCLVLEGDDETTLLQWFEQAYDLMDQILPQDPEPMMNMLVNWDEDRWKIFIFPRKLHRPWQYFAEGNQQILLSPASVDFGGVLITPREEDHKKMVPSDIQDIFSQVTWDKPAFDELVKSFAHS